MATAEVVDLVGRRLERGAGDMPAGRVARQTGDDATGVASPVRREQPGEGRHEHDIAAVGHGPGERLDLGRVADDAEVVAQPADQGPGDRDRALQRIGRGIVAEPRRDRRDQPVARGDRLLAGLHQHETARAVGALELTRLETGLPEQRGLLVSEVARDRDAGQVPHPVPIDLGGGADPGQHRRGDAHGIEQLGLPGQGGETHQHRPGGVRDIRDVDAADRRRRSAAR